MPQTPTVTPNLYQLSGHHLHVTYSTSGIDGRPHMTYQDTHESKSFKGDEIRMVECDLGTLVSVTLRLTVDVGSTTLSVIIPRIVGSTTLSVIIPRMRISPASVAAVHTECITTVHSMPFTLPGAVQGQLDTYTVTALRGTAQAVVY